MPFIAFLGQNIAREFYLRGNVTLCHTTPSGLTPEVRTVPRGTLPLKAKSFKFTLIFSASLKGAERGPHPSLE